MPAPSSDRPGDRRADRYARIADSLSAEVGVRLRAAREEAGLSQTALGEMLGYAPTMISALEKGRRRLKLEDLARVCIALDKEPGYFLRTASVPSPAPATRVGLHLRAEVAALPSDRLRRALTSFLDEVDADKPVRSSVPDLHHLKPDAAAGHLRKACGVATPRVEMEDVCAVLGIRLYWRDFPEALSAVILEVGDEDFIVGVNQDHHEHRRRFSIAHEIGHAVLRHKASHHVEYLDNEAWEPPNYRYLDEREANQFAAAILMDAQHVRKDVANGIRDVRQLAERYDVSEVAMNFRLMNLGLS